MEIILGLAVVIVLVVVVLFAISSAGKAIGPPDPASLSDEAL